MATEGPGVGARARAASGGLSDATGPPVVGPDGGAAVMSVPDDVARPPAGADRGAAVEWLRQRSTESTEGGGLAALRRAAEAGVDQLAVVLVGWELVHDGPPRLSGHWRHRLIASLGQAERVARFGHGQVGAGALWVLEQMEVTAAELAEDPDAERPRCLAFYAWQLRREARRWRRGARGLGAVADTGQDERERAAFEEFERRRRARRRRRRGQP